MDIKLKKMNKYTLTKILLFVATVVMLTIMAGIMENIIIREDYRSAVGAKEYREHSSYFDNHRKVIDSIMQGRSIPETNDFIYYCKTQDGDVYTNTNNSTPQFFENYSTDYLIFEQEEGSSHWNTGYNNEYLIDRDIEWNLIDWADQFFISFSEEYIKQQQLNYNLLKDQVGRMLLITFVLGVVSFVLVIIQMFLAGREPGEEKIRWERIDKLHVDLQLFLGSIVVLIWLFGTNLIFSTINIYQTHTVQEEGIMLTVAGILNLMVIAVLGYLFLSICRKYKGGLLIKHSIIYRATEKIYCFCKDLFTLAWNKNLNTTNRLFLRSIIFIAASMIQVLCFIFFLAYTAFPLSLMAVFLEFTFIYWYISSNNKTYKEINEGIDDIREEQLKAERMRVDLVANVSHDLKTPLTSIISYLDLLEKEELNESSSDYVKILGEKSQRLKKIVEDLFDLSKSTSGNMPVKLENIDMKKLVEQTLADMQDIISQKEKQIVTDLPQDGVMVYGDSDKLYRVFQNLLDNALKYSLENTRIFIELKQEGGKVKLLIKNTASYEMNFKADEIVQRFQRGDDSRNTEGSGLGLAIAESFTRNFGGTFQVHIDGDMFRVEIEFKEK